MFLTYYQSKEKSEKTKNLLRTLGYNPKVIILDSSFDDGALSLKTSLEYMGYSSMVYPMEKIEFDVICNTLTTICISEKTECILNEDRLDEIFCDVTDLEYIWTGAMFTCAFNNGATVVYCDESGNLTKVPFNPLPDVSRIKYSSQKVLNILYDEEELDLRTISERLYAEKIVDMDDKQKKQFFSTHHNTYKVLENLISKRWVRYSRNTSQYSLTSLGITARALILNKNAQGEEPIDEKYV